ncbi:MAG: S1C family serine protease, partial [Bacillota bacterium]
VLVVGSPFGFAGTVTQGIVSFVGRKLVYQQSSGQKVEIPDAIQTDAPINPGNSGGALVDRAGHLVGVPSVKLTGDGAEGLGFAIGIKTVGEAIARAKEAGVLVAAHQSDLVAALADQGLAVA